VTEEDAAREAEADPQYDEHWWEQIGEPPDDDEFQSVSDAEKQDVEPDEFWKSRPVLAHLHDFARARRVGPWAVLGAVLARVVAATPPMVQLPPIIGGFASLNLFVGLVGRSGDGKDIAQKVARDALDMSETSFMVAPLGSGEGLSHMYMRQEKGSPDPTQYNTSALVTIGEIDTLGALMQRQSSTVASQLRQAAMGEQLGFFYVDQTKRMLVPEHKYRMSLIAGIQPKRSAALLGDADGGTPQRFIWLPAGDPAAPDFVLAPPAPMLWQPPDWTRGERLHIGGMDRIAMRMPDVVVETVSQARLDRLKERGDALDGHALLTREKVAVALAVLDGRVDVTAEDWHLSATVMRVSDSQRARCQKALAEEAQQANIGKAVAEAERAVVVAERVDEAAIRAAAKSIRRKLAEAGSAGMARAELRRKLKAGAQRDNFEAAVDALLATGDIRTEHVEYHGVNGDRFFHG
jgi:hypothetical protein